MSTTRPISCLALRSRSRAEVLAAALRLGVPMAPVNTPEEVVAAEQTRVRRIRIDRERLVIILVGGGVVVLFQHAPAGVEVKMSEVINVEDEESPQDVDQPSRDAEVERSEPPPTQEQPESSMVEACPEKPEVVETSSVFVEGLFRLIGQPTTRLARSSM